MPPNYAKYMGPNKLFGSELVSWKMLMVAQPPTSTKPHVCQILLHCAKVLLVEKKRQRRGEKTTDALGMKKLTANYFIPKQSAQWTVSNFWQKNLTPRSMVMPGWPKCPRLFLLSDGPSISWKHIASKFFVEKSWSVWWCVSNKPMVPFICPTGIHPVNLWTRHLQHPFVAPGSFFTNR